MSINKNIYYFIYLSLALCAISSTLVLFVNADSQLVNAMQKLKISPDLISVDSYINTIKIDIHGKIVNPGDSVAAKNFKDLNMAGGKITWDASNNEAMHTLLLLDLDRKPSNSNNTLNIYNQFTGINIPGHDTTRVQSVVSYETPIVPCQPSTKHRILMLAFHQEQNIDLADIVYISASVGQSSKRENFRLHDFMNRHRLSLIAANVVLATGEVNGICSGSLTLHSIQSVSTVLIAMVLVATLFNYPNRRSIVN